MSKRDLYTYSHMLNVWSGAYHLLEELRIANSVEIAEHLYGTIYYTVEIIIDALEKNINHSDITEEQFEQLTADFEYVSKEAFKAYTAIKSKVA